MLPAFIATVLFSFSILYANRSAKIIGGVAANFWRTLFATVLLAVWAHLFGQGLKGPALPFFLISGVVGFGLGDQSLFRALPLLGSRLSMLMVHCLAAPLAAMIEWLWLGTHLTPGQGGWGLVILAGVALALAPKKNAAKPVHFSGLGILFGAGAACGQALGAVLSRKAYLVAQAAAFPMDGLSATYQRIVGGVVIAGISYVLSLRANAARPVAEPLRRAAPSVMLNALAGPTLGVACFQWALQTTPSGVVLPILATAPIVVIPLAYWVEGERPTRRSIFGGVLAVIGAVALARSR